MRTLQYRNIRYTDEIVLVFDETQDRVYFEVEVGQGPNGFIYPESLPRKEFYERYTEI